MNFNEFESLHVHLKKYLNDEQIKVVKQAYLVAHRAHLGQVRRTGEPYITHPLAVATILATMQIDQPTIIAAILHDVIEDTPVKKEDIIDQFGKEVADLVDGVTKLARIEFESRAEAQAENFRKMVMAMARDIRVILIKLADRLHNMRTINSLPPEKRRRIAKETLEIFAPIANRLGMHAFRVEFEDLGFLALYPMRYRILQTAVQQAQVNREEMMELINQQIERNFQKYRLRARSLTSREKNIYSIYKKMRDKHLSFSEVMDVYGFRVIVDTVDTCYRVLGILHNLYKPITQRFKDYIAIPKANGYQSLHTTLFGPYGVPIEVQIRTEDMHKMAEYGISAHWIYKTERTEKTELTDTQQRTQEWLKSVLEMNQSTKNSLEFIENMKTDLFPDEVYVFTPKGSILELPAGATAVDFAYAIHSDIGNRCTGVKLDRRPAPLNTPLITGQQVEIITGANTRPNPTWLNFIVTGKARSAIKHFLKKQQREESIELGKRLVEKTLHEMDIAFTQISNDQLEKWINKTQSDSLNYLFEEIGLGNRSSIIAAKQLAELVNVENNNSIFYTEKKISDVESSRTPLLIRGTEGIAIILGRCCHPIPGDPIGGYIETGQGLIVHNEHCSALSAYHHRPDRYISLHWEKKIHSDFPVPLQMTILNKLGSLASLALTLSEADSNILSIHVEEFDKRYSSVNTTIGVRNRIHLAHIFRKLRHNRSIVRVSRQKQKKHT